MDEEENSQQLINRYKHVIYLFSYFRKETHLSGHALGPQKLSWEQFNLPASVTFYNRSSEAFLSPLGRNTGWSDLRKIDFIKRFSKRRLYK